MTDPGALLAGRVGRPHGVRGEVYVVVISDDPGRFAPGSQITAADGRRLVIEAARTHGDRLLVKFAGVESRTDAEAVRGPLYVDAGAVRELGPDEFWDHDLIGCTAADPAGAPLGEVVGVHHGPGQDRLEIATAAGVRLVPLVKEIVTGVDVAARTVVVDAPHGLLD